MSLSDTKDRDKLLLIGFSFLAGIIFNYLFYGKSTGVSYPIFIFIILSLFWWSTRESIKISKGAGWFILIPIILLSATFGIYSNPVLEFINFLLIPFLVVVHTLLITNSSLNWWELGILTDILNRVVPLTITNIGKPLWILVDKFKPTGDSTTQSTGKKIFTGLLVSIPILLLVLPLLSSADAAFSHYLANLHKIGEYINFRDLFGQTMIFLFVSLYVLGYIWSFYDKCPGTKSQCKKSEWDPTTVVTVLFVMNLVYLLFSIVQFSYLYGSQGNLLPDGFTYAEYARRGFAELVMVSIINLGILLSCLRFVKKDSKFLYLLVRVFLSMLIIFTLNMLFSAHFKMSLYEEAYGLTYLRVFVHYFMGFLFVLFLLALVNIFSARINLVKAYLVVALAAYTLLNFLNVDLIIARYNLNMDSDTVQVDVSYVSGLSYDAIPEIAKFAEGNNQELSKQIKEYLVMKRAELAQATPWQSMNYSRYRAYSALSKGRK